VVAQLLGDIQEGVHTLMANPDVVKGGTAPMYAAANIMPDRGMLGEVGGWVGAGDLTVASSCVTWAVAGRATHIKCCMQPTRSSTAVGRATHSCTPVKLNQEGCGMTQDSN
jgi:hypothetical protein